MNNDDKKFSDAPIYFLGICDKFNKPVAVRFGSHELRRTDLIGLRSIFVSSVFPFSSGNFYLAFLLDNNLVSDFSNLKLGIKNSETSEVVGFLTISAQASGFGDGFPSRFTLMAAKILDGLYSLPGSYKVLLKWGEKEIFIGGFDLVHKPALPLTEERIKALKSDPKAAKYIRFTWSCNECGDSIKAWVGVDGRKDSGEGYLWYEDLPSQFICSCGKVKGNLKYLRENLHGLLGYKVSPFSLEEAIERNYTRAALNKVTDDFWAVINQKKTEEEIQNFIECNPIVLSCFSPELLKFKAPATAKYKTDFALLNQKGELILVEIERSDTPLYTKSGVQHSKLTQAIGQVESWLQEARRNKLGLIDDLGIEGLKIDMVTAIKGVVVAGRSLKQYERHIEKLHTRSDISFYTYDDLFKFLRNITLKIEEI